jgi:uncharacterized repeat protein (TIGR01451 family)
VLRDWGFEGLDGSLILGEWQAGGVITPEISADARHTGDYAALLGWQALTFTQQSADSSIAQTVSLPITISNPTLSFFYQLNGAAAASGSWFEVQVDNGTAAIPLWSTDSNTAGWTHRWFDLSPWAGQSINLLFNVHQQAGAPRTWAYLDEVSVGSVYPDLWVSKDSLTAAALPGEQVIYTIAYGNRGSVAASGARITVTLPADLFFVEASPPPTFDTLSLLWAWEWEVGNLAAGSGPFSIVLTTTVAPTATMLNTLTSTASIRSVSPHRPSVSIGEVETANNVAQATVLVAYQTYLPLLAK